MNSCSYLLTALNSGPPYEADMDIECGVEGDAIEVENESTGCVMKIGEQGDLEGVSLANFGSGPQRGVEVDFGIEGLKSSLHGGFFKCLATNGASYTVR